MTPEAQTLLDKIAANPPDLRQMEIDLSVAEHRQAIRLLELEKEEMK